MTQLMTDNKEKQRFECNVDGQMVFADYRCDGAVLSILYVEAPPALRGTGAAGHLMTGIMELARRENWKVRPVCGYAASWIKRHKEYHDMMAA